MKKVTDYLYFEDVRMIPAFKNFSGRHIPPYNPKGMRKFNIEIDDVELAEQLDRDGWNIKFDTKEREDGTRYLPHMEVKVKYHDEDNKKRMNPKIQMREGDNRVFLTEETVDILDSKNILNIRSIEISPYNWIGDDGEIGGVTAYLKRMVVEVERDMFDD